MLSQLNEALRKFGLRKNLC